MKLLAILFFALALPALAQVPMPPGPGLPAPTNAVLRTNDVRRQITITTNLDNDLVIVSVPLKKVAVQSRTLTLAWAQPQYVWEIHTSTNLVDWSRLCYVTGQTWCTFTNDQVQAFFKVRRVDLETGAVSDWGGTQ